MNWLRLVRQLALLVFVSQFPILGTAVAQTAAEISVPFVGGFVGTEGTNTQQADSITTFTTLGIDRAFFVQVDDTGAGEFVITGTQGNDIGGLVRLVYPDRTIIEIEGAIIWQGPKGGPGDYFGFLPSDGVDVTLPGGYRIQGDDPQDPDAIARSNFGLLRVGVPNTLTDGNPESGNAAGVLAELNAYLGEVVLARPSGPVTVDTLTTPSTTPTITGTATLAAGETLTVIVDGVVYTGSDITFDGDSWSLTIPGANELTLGTTYSVTATITNADGYTLSDVTSDEVTIADAPDAGQSTVAASPTSIVANGTDTSTITVTVRDAQGDLFTSGTDVFLATTAGTLAATSGTSNGSGVFTTTLTSSTNVEAATVTAYLGTDATGGEIGTADVTFIAGPAALLAFTTEPSASTVAGTAFAQQPVVTAYDAFDNVATGFTGSVTVGLTTGSGTLSGTASVEAVAGVASFSGLSIDLVGDDKVLTASSGLLTEATTSAFTITVGAIDADTSSVTTTTPHDADGTDASTVTVVLRDANNNVVTGVLASDFSLTADGSETYGDASESETAGTYTLSVTNTVAETVTVTLVVDGVTLSDTPTIVFQDAAGPTISLEDGEGGADDQTAGGTTTINTSTTTVGTFRADEDLDTTVGTGGWVLRPTTDSEADLEKFDLEVVDGKAVVTFPYADETSPEPGTYYVDLCATDAAGNETCITIELIFTTVPSVPLNLAVTPGDGSGSADWDTPASDGGSDLTFYEVEYSSDGGDTWTPFADDITPGTTASNVTGLDNDRAYQIRVAAKNANGIGPWATSEPFIPAAPDTDGEGDPPPVEPGDGVVLEDGKEVTVDLTVTEEDELDLSASNGDFSITLGPKDSDGDPIPLSSTDPVLRLQSGASADVGGDGFEPGTYATLWLFDENGDRIGDEPLGRYLVQEDGTFSGDAPLPDLPDGDYTLQLTGRAADGAPRSVSVGIGVYGVIEGRLDELDFGARLAGSTEYISAISANPGDTIEFRFGYLNVGVLPITEVVLNVPIDLAFLSAVGADDQPLPAILTCPDGTTTVEVTMPPATGGGEVTVNVGDACELASLKGGDGGTLDFSITVR